MKLKDSLLVFAVFVVFFAQIQIYPQASPPEIKSLSIKADVILTGKVIKQNSSWNKDKSRIFTNVVIQKDECLKGSFSGNSLSLITPGGEVGGVGELYSHMPRFGEQEEVLLFVKRDKDMKYKVLGGEDGKLTLYRDKNGALVTSYNKEISSLKKEIQAYLKTQ